MTVLHITCDNCGAKYKLPETFTGSQAKCQKCGSVIDVAKQRGQADGAGGGAAASAAKPAAAKPAAAARPAIDRSKEAPKAAERAASPAKHKERPARHGKDEAESAGDGKRGRHHHEKKKSNSMPLILGGVGLVAIVVVVVIMMGGGKQPATDTTAKLEPTATKTPPANVAPATPPPAAAVDKPEDAKPAAPATAPAAAPTEASAPPPAVPDDPTRIKRPWEKMRNPPATMDAVADPKSYGEVKWPEGFDAAKQTEIRALAEEAAGDGIRSVRAKKKLEEIGFGAMFGIVEQLQRIDYKSAEQSMIAFDLNKLLDQITAGLNARFEPVEATEELVPAKAEWNTRSVKGWMDLLASIPDEATFKKGRAERVKKQADK